MKLRLYRRVVITDQINGDDTPVGTKGMITNYDGETYTVRLDGDWPDGNLYYTDGSNLKGE